VRSIATVSFLLATGLVWAASPSQAVHDNGMFELDGNTVHNSATTPPWDWNSLFNSSGGRIVTPDPDNGPLLASTFVSDSALPDQSYFTSNKDIQPISHTVQHWGCDPINNPLAKDNLLNAYAALVQVPNDAPDNAGHTVLYLGSERGSNNGTSFAGFWLLKDKSVGCSGSNSFSGQHTDGDLLIVSDYTNGGGTQDVTVYRWTGDDASGAPVLQGSFNGSICSGSLSNDNACAIANSSTITTPWSPTSHASNTFVETGIDMTNVLGQAGGCFTTFLAETRSSDQLTATLKDFAGGQFNTCAPPPITTTATPGGSLNPPGTAQHDVATVAAVGNRPTPTGSVDFFLCAPNQVVNHTCPAGTGSAVSTETLAGGSATSDTINGSTTPNDNALGEYCWRAEYTPDEASSGYYVASVETDFTNECFTIAHFTPNISTQIAVTGTNSPGLGFTTLGDTATLHNFGGTVTGETVTFKLYDVTANPNCAGAPVFTTTGTLSAGGVATTSQTYQPTAAHTYTWIASYPGDTLNSSATGACSDANESVTIVGAQIDVSKSANPPGPVSAGTAIGFDITVSNSGAVPAKDVTVTDNLPAGAGSDLNWSLDPAYTGCSITGAVGSQVLTCNLGTVAGGATLPVIHVSSPTTPLDCGVVSNKATVSTSNGTGGDSDVATVTVLCPHLTIDKAADAASVTVGSPIGFTVTVTNDGAGTATGVHVSDPLPTGEGIVWTIASQAGPLTCAINSGTLDCTGTLAAGAVETVHVTSPTVWNADNNSCGTYPNIAHVSAGNVVGSPQASASEDVLCPDLHVVKDADLGTVNAGQDIGFTITASNTGQGDATGALIHDVLPTGTGISWTIDVAGTSGPLTCSITAGALDCTGTLGAGQTEVVHITSPTNGSSCGSYDNTATLSATNDPNSVNDGATTHVACANIEINKTADDAVVNVGDPIGFTVTIHNKGDGSATGVDMEDPLPVGQGINWQVDVAGTSGPLSCSISSGTLSCTGDLPAGGTETVHITSTTQWTQDGETEINSCGDYPNVATVDWPLNPDDPISAQATTTVQCPALAIIKTADADTVSAGDQIGFKIKVSNAGPGTATDVTIHDELPGGTDVAWLIDPAVPGCSITGGLGSQVLDCDLGDLGPEDSVEVHVVSGTTQNSCKAYDNTAHLLAGNAPGSDSEATTTVLCPDIHVTKTADDGTHDQTVGDTTPIGFIITVSNAGPGTARDVSLHDGLPSGPEGSDVNWTIDSVTGADPSTCAITGGAGDQSLNCDFGDLAPEASITIHVVSDTSFASCGDYPNLVTVTASNDADQTDSAVISVFCPLDFINVTADAASVVATNNAHIGFTIDGGNKSVKPAPVGTVFNAVMVSGLPANAHWTIDQAYAGPGTCAIAGPDGSQILTCQLGDLAPGETFSVHIRADLDCTASGSFTDHATLSSSNVADVSDQDTTTISGALCPAHNRRPQHHETASTGVPMLGLQILWGVAFITFGGIVLMAARRRRAGIAGTEGME
jgi:uncharacterized repeat protein (TIGR01451 family)